MTSLSLTHHQTRKRIHYPWEVCILATSTPSILRHTTLQVLKQCGVPISKLTLVVQGKEEEQTFREQLPRGSYGRLLVSQDVGVAALLNTIYRAFKVGTPLVVCRDRIEGFLQTVNGRVGPLKTLVPLFQSMFPLCTHEKVGLWGLAPNSKGDHSKCTIIKGVKRISGALWGFYNPGNIANFSATMDVLPEFQSVFQFSKVYGGILRFNSVSAKWNPEKVGKQRDAEIERLAEKYPEYVVLDGDAKSGSLELRFLQDKDKPIGET